MIVTNEGVPRPKLPSPISDVGARVARDATICGHGIARNARSYGSGGCKPSE